MAEVEGDIGWRTLWFLLGGQRGRLMLACSFSLMAAVMELLPFFLLTQGAQAVLGYIEQQNTVSELTECFYQLSFWMVIILVVKTLVYSIAYFFSHQTAFFTLTRARKLLVTRLAWAPIHWIKRYHSGQLKKMVLQDVDKIENLIAHHTVEVSVSICTPLLITLYLLWIDWRLALAALSVAPFAIVCSMLFMRDMDAMQDKYHQVTVNLNNATVEYLRNISVMKLFHQGSGRLSAMVKHSQNYYRAVEALTRLSVPRWALFTSLLGANMLFVLPMGSFLVLHNAITLPELVLAILLGSGMLRPLFKISHFFTDSRDVLAGIRRLNPVLNAEKSVSVDQPKIDNELLSEVGGLDIKLRNVRFSFGHNVVVPNLNLTLPAGSTTVMVGASGSGKSTLAQLIAGMLLPEQGLIVVNGHPISDLTDMQKASLISVATQDAFLFKGTIRENLMLARDSVQHSEIEKAVSVAQAGHLLNSLANGYETQVNEQGAGLSGGERQRLALARALLADTPILLLDEATSFADNLTQKRFYRDLQNNYPEKTVLIITHRLAGIEFSDQVVVLDKGQIKGVGIHAELMQSNTYYQHIWRLQRDSQNWCLGRVHVCR